MASWHCSRAHQAPWARLTVFELGLSARGAQREHSVPQVVRDHEVARLPGQHRPAVCSRGPGGETGARRLATSCDRLAQQQLARKQAAPPLACGVLPLPTPAAAPQRMQLPDPPGWLVSTPVPRSRTARTGQPPMAAGGAARSRSNTAALLEGGLATK